MLYKDILKNFDINEDNALMLITILERHLEIDVSDLNRVMSVVEEYKGRGRTYRHLEDHCDVIRRSIEANKQRIELIGQMIASGNYDVSNLEN